MGSGPGSLGPPGLLGSRDTGAYGAEFPFKVHSKRSAAGHRPTFSTALQTKKPKSLGYLQSQAPESTEMQRAAAVHRRGCFSPARCGFRA